MVGTILSISVRFAKLAEADGRNVFKTRIIGVINLKKRYC
ncbi:9731_t:CDS:2 [Entrophospora sp. SA101]|nr:9731_t:CDS:2 [Entrophospora sp. SA101]